MRKEIKATVKTVYCILSTMWTKLTFFLATILPLTNSLYFTVKCEPDEVDANVSSDAILSCHVEPSRDVSEDLTKWTLKWEHGTKKVHARRNGLDDWKEQDKQFQDRTQIDNEKMKKGIISLKIASVSKKDEGTYTCLVTVMDGDEESQIGSVRLHVVEAGGPDDQKIQSGTAVTPTTGKPQDPTVSHKIVVAVGVIAFLVLTAIGLFVLHKKGWLPGGTAQGPQHQPVPLRDNQREPNNREEPNPDDQELDPLQNGNDAEPDE